jgi:hypothetical protein
VPSSLVGTQDFKSGVTSEEGGRWVRFPCTSANDLRGKEVKFSASFFLWVCRGMQEDLIKVKHISTLPGERRITDIKQRSEAVVQPQLPLVSLTLICLQPPGISYKLS